MRVTLILPLSGAQYSEKVGEGCKAAWEAAGIYGEAEAKAIEQFKEIFKDQNFPPGSSILFTISPTGLVVCMINISSCRIHNLLFQSVYGRMLIN